MTKDELFNSHFPVHPLISTEAQAIIANEKLREISIFFASITNSLPEYFAKLKRLKHQSKKMLFFITQKELRYGR